MADFTPYRASGWKVFYGDSSAATTVEITNLTSVSPPSGSNPAITFATMASTYEQKIAGLPVPGQFKFKYQHQTTQAQAIQTLRGAGTIKWFRIDPPDSASNNYHFQGFIAEQTMDPEPTAISDVDVMVEITSDITVGA